MPAAAHAGAQPSTFSKIGSALADFNPIARLEKHGDMEKETCEIKFRFQQQKMFSSAVSIAANDQHVHWLQIGGGTYMYSFSNGWC